MPTISRFVIWERPPDFTEINPALASLLRETGIESLDMVHGQEPSHLGRNAPEIKHLLERSNLGMLAHAWWPARETTPDSLLDQSVDLLDLNARSTNCLLAAGIRTIRALRQQGYHDLLRLKNMGRKSLREILEKMAAFRYKEDPPPPEIHPDQCWFPFAAVGYHNDTTKDSLVDQTVEVLKLSGRSTRCPRSVQFKLNFACVFWCKRHQMQHLSDLYCLLCKRRIKFAKSCGADASP